MSCTVILEALHHGNPAPRSFESFEADNSMQVLVLAGGGGQFCAGAASHR